jgi:hypothetical protein
MAGMKSAAKIFLIALLILGSAAFVVSNWSWVFAKRIQGEILNVERVTNPTAILSSRATDEQIHSYSILIKGQDGKLYTASSEDRQWQVAKKGYCVDAVLYRYPPWDLSKGGTFFNARLRELSLCPGQSAPPAEVPEPPPSESPAETPPSGG